MLKILTEKLSGFSLIEILLTLPSNQVFSVIFRFFSASSSEVKTDQEVGEVSRSLFVSILPSEEHFRLLFSIFKCLIFFCRVRMKIYDLIVENLILLFFLAGVATLFFFRFINQNSRWWCFDILIFFIFGTITKLIAGCFVIVFLVAGVIGAWFLWVLIIWIIGYLVSYVAPIIMMTFFLASRHLAFLTFM